jgi:hypothetical protein
MGEMKWISVKDRLPEENDYFLCYRTNIYRGKEISLYEVLEFIEKFKVWRGNGYPNTEDVTHWMPLPEPPKDDN